MDALAILLAAALLLLAALHVYWGASGTWPGRSPSELAQIVVGGPAGMPMPSSAACAMVAITLVAASVLVLAVRGLVPLPVPSALVRGGTWILALALFARGAFGFFETRLRPVVVGSPYARLNILIYSPLALALGAAAGALAV